MSFTCPLVRDTISEDRWLVHYKTEYGVSVLFLVSVSLCSSLCFSFSVLWIWKESRGLLFLNIIFLQKQMLNNFLKSSLLISFIKALQFWFTQNDGHFAISQTFFKLFGLRRSLSSLSSKVLSNVIVLVIVLSFLNLLFLVLQETRKAALLGFCVWIKESRLAVLCCL